MNCPDCLHERTSHDALGCNEHGCDCQIPDVYILEALADDVQERVREVYASVLFDILNECKSQTAKLGEQNHDAYRWLAILSEEIGETAQAALHDEFGGEAKGTLRTELVQVAAVAIQWLECIDRNGVE